MGFVRVPVGLASEATVGCSDANAVEKKKSLCFSQTCPMVAVLGHQGFVMNVKWARDKMMLENSAVLLGSSRRDRGRCSYGGVWIRSTLKALQPDPVRRCGERQCWGAPARQMENMSMLQHEAELTRVPDSSAGEHVWQHTLLNK